MLGFGDKHGYSVDPTTLPIFVHAVQSSESFALAQKVWQNNSRYAVQDASNRKELMRFVFSQPSCVVWLERDQGRTDTFELILMWGSAEENEEGVTEVYVITTAAGPTIGDDSRAKNLLSAILASPAIVPVRANTVNKQQGAK